LVPERRNTGLRLHFQAKGNQGQYVACRSLQPGGTGDFSLIDDLVRVEFYLLAKEGYVVLATEYRSIGDKGRRDEWGGTDVNDVLNLVAVAEGLGYIDMDRMFMLGVSRGGMMTYLALKNRVPVKAAAVIAGPSDLESLAAIRSDFLDGDDGYDGWAKVCLILSIERKSTSALVQRSLGPTKSRCWVPQVRLRAARHGGFLRSSGSGRSAPSTFWQFG
jgi:hypothetical protein